MKRFLIVATFCGTAACAVLSNPLAAQAMHAGRPPSRHLSRTAGNGQPARVSAAEYTRRGTLKLQQGDYRGAIVDLTQAIRLNPNDAVAYYNRARARYHRLQPGPAPQPQRLRRLQQPRPLLLPPL